MAELFRAARRSDAGRIVQLIQSGFDAHLLGLFIYGCSGIERFVELQIDATSVGGESAYFVSEASGSVVACIELRRIGETLFLNYVAVDPSYQGRGCGSRLLRHAIESLADSDKTKLELDVLETNAPALRWYDVLGMSTQSQTGWYRFALPALEARSSNAAVMGMPQAMISLRELGFGQFTVSCGSTSYPVGMLGRSWFRVTNVAALTDTTLLSTLRKVDEKREILALVPMQEISGATLLATTQRRSGRLTDILPLLRARS